MGKTKQIKVKSNWDDPKLDEISNFNDMLVSFANLTRKLADQVYQHTMNRQKWNNISETRCFAEWAESYGQAHETLLFTGELVKNKMLSCKPLHQAPSIDILYQNFNFFSNSVWTPRFSSKFTSRLFGLNDKQIKLVFCYMKTLLNGHFISTVRNQCLKNNVVLHATTQILPTYNSIFTCQIDSKRYILFMVGVEKIPVFDKPGKNIIRFDYKQYLKFLDILADGDMINILRTCNRIASNVNRDLSRSEISDQLVKSKNQISGFQLFKEVQAQGGISKNQFVESVYTQYAQQDNHMDEKNKNAYKFVPATFDSEFLTAFESKSFVLDESQNRYLSKNKLAEIERKKYLQYKAQVNKEMLQKFGDFSKATKLVELLQKIPNFKIQLTNEEMEVVGQDGNVMVIGRSGTGKTTCAILRLFAMEMIFKMRVTLYQQKHRGLIKETQFDAQDVDKNIGLHCMFVTASPVLTNEVKRYYKKLTTQIKDELEKKRQKVLAEKREKKKQQQQPNDKDDEMQILQKKPKNQAEQDDDDDDDYDDDDQGLEDQMEQELGDIKLTKQISHESQNEAEDKADQEFFENFDEDDENDEDDKKANENYEHFNSINDLKEEDFPGFFTVKKLIMMIDACMTEPFFSRNKDNEIIGSDAKATWHNETKGVLMIDQYHRKLQSGKNEEEIRQMEDQIDADSDIGDFEDEEELEEEYQRQLELQQKNLKQKELEKKRQNPKAKRMAFEVDYDYFVNHFWPTIKIQYKQFNLTPTTVWTEIYSTIKGSASAHSYYCWYLSQYSYVYFGNHGNSSFLSQDQKRQIFKIFLAYETWKQKEGGYDLMDVVNYLLVGLQRGRYQAQAIHYLMIDEVQDLPHAVLLLLMKVTQQGLFFSGDTAQTIAQGVGFRFCDMHEVFDKSYFDDFAAFNPPVVKQLTVNFRSHNKILELANSIVTTVEIFFPQTIDKLKKERSNIDGPKPILIADANPEILFFILQGEEQFKSAFHSSKNAQNIIEKQPLEFGCNQVIIVRDQESKKTIPQVLQYALVLTVYEAKGLEFDDVILWNFFTDSKIDEQQWRLLYNLETEEEWVSKDHFLKSVTIHDEDRLNKVDYSEKTLQEKKELEEKKKEEIEKKRGRQDENTIKKKNNNSDDDNEDDDEDENDDDQEQSCGIYGLKENEDGQLLVKRVKRKKEEGFTKKKFKKNISLYSQLCTELKQLYVAVTRPRNRLIIYDDNHRNRIPFEHYWKNLNVVESYDGSIINGILNNEESRDKQKETNLPDSNEAKMFKAILQKTNSVEWKKQGLNMFKNKYFEQAMKCFERAGEKEMYTRASAYFKADQASKNVVQIEAEQNYIENGLYGYGKMNSKEKKKRRKEFKVQLRENLLLFQEAGNIFVSIGKLKQAAQCFFSAKNYKQAEELFLEMKSYRQAGESAYLLQNFKRAAEHYNAGKDYIRVIECYDILNNWSKILETINQYSSIIPDQDMEIFIRKYAPLALQELVSQVENENAGEDEEENNNKNYNENTEKIEEQDEEEDDDDEDDDSNDSEGNDEEEEEEEQKVEDLDLDISKQNNFQQQQIKQTQSSQNVEDISFSVQNQTEIEKSVQMQQKVDQQNNNISEMSFSIIGQSQNNNNINKENENQDNISSFSLGNLNENNNNNSSQLDDFEHLSHIDMEDQWLKTDKGSVIESISEARKSQSNIISEYSAVEFSAMTSPNVQLVKTKGDIFIQDSVMQTIIRYINMFNADFQKEMDQLRSQKSLMTKRKDFRDVQDSEYDQMIDFAVDLDNIDIDFVYLILDILETFKVYKLCIFVCNRYNLSQRLGRYVLSLSQKYSTLSNANASIMNNILHAGKNRFIVLEKAFVSSVALHNILESINPSYLKGKIEGDYITPQNSLGIECYQGLVLLGYWKKILFMLDYTNALALSSSYGDFKNYKLIYMNQSKNQKEYKDNILKVANAKKPDFEFLPFEIPSGELEIDLSIVSLEHVIQHNIQVQTNKFLHNQFLVPYYQQEIGFQAKNKAEDEISQIITFPSYFAYNGVLWNYFDNINRLNNELKEVNSKQIPVNESEQKILTQINLENKKLKEYITSGFKNLHKIITEPLHNFQSDIINLRIFDLITFAMIICNGMNSGCNSLRNLFQFELETNEFMDIFDTIYHIMRILSEQSILNRHSQVLLRGMFAPFGVRLIKNSEILDLINNNHVLIHRGSSIIPDLISFKSQKQNFARQVYNDIQRQVIDEVFFADVDHEYIIAPFDIVLTIVKEKIYARIIPLLNEKIQKESQKIRVSKEDLNLEAFEVASQMGMLLLKNNMDIMLKNNFKENLDEKINSLNLYKNLKPCEIVRRYVKKQQEQSAYDVVDGDEDILEYLRNNPHLRAAKQIKKQKIKSKKTAGIDSEGNINSTIKIPQQKKHLNNLLKYNIGKCTQPLNKYAQESLMMLVNYYAEKSFTNGSNTIRGSSNQIIHQNVVKLRSITGFLGLDGAFYEFNNIIRKYYDAPKTYKAYRNLDDALIFKEYGLIPEYSDAIFDYFGQKFSSSNMKHKLCTLEESVTLNLISHKSGLSNNKSNLKLPQHFLRYIPNLVSKNGMKEICQQNLIFTVQSNIIPFRENEILTECAYWIGKIVENQQYDPKNFMEITRIFSLIFTILMNLEDFMGEILQNLKNCSQQLVNQNVNVFRDLDDNNVFKRFQGITSYKDLLKLREEFIDKQNLFSFPVYELEQQYICTVEITDKSDAQKQEDKSYSDYYRDQRLIAQRKQAKNIIFNFIMKHKKNLMKSRSKVIKSPIILYTHCQKVDFNTSTAYLKSINEFAYRYQGVLEIFRQLEKVKRDILNTFMQTFVENALDFHYIALQLRTLCDEKIRFLEELHYILGDYTIDNVNKFVKNFVNYKKDLDQRLYSFINWKEMNVKFESNVNKLLKKNKRIFTVKWYTRSKQSSKLTKMAKKRAGLKKLKAIEEKKQRLNMFK